MKNISAQRVIPIVILAAFLVAVVFNYTCNVLLLRQKGEMLQNRITFDRMKNTGDKLAAVSRYYQGRNPVLLLGSSQVHWGVDPAQLTRSRARLKGHPFFNLGLNGTYFEA